MYDHYTQILESYNLTHNDALLIVCGLIIFIQLFMLSFFCSRKSKKAEKNAAKK